jgi:hypothetical protein
VFVCLFVCLFVLCGCRWVCLFVWVDRLPPWLAWSQEKAKGQRLKPVIVFVSGGAWIIGYSARAHRHAHAIGKNSLEHRDFVAVMAPHAQSLHGFNFDSDETNKQTNKSTADACNRSAQV